MPQDRESGDHFAVRDKPKAKFDIFLSYARHDVKRLSNLIPLLEGASRKVFRDTEELKGGEQFPDRLHAALQASEIIVCCWSPAFFSSRWCLHEARYASKRGKLLPLVVAPLDEIDLPPDLENLNFFDLTGWNGEFKSEDWQSVNRDIRRRLASPLERLEFGKRALVRTIYELPHRYHSVVEANYDRLGGSTFDMQMALVEIADTLGRYWQRLKSIEANEVPSDRWANEYELFKSDVVQNLPPYDPYGGSIQKIENADRVRNAVANLVIDQVRVMWPENDVVDYDTWASHFIRCTPLPPLSTGY